MPGMRGNRACRAAGHGARRDRLVKSGVSRNPGTFQAGQRHGQDSTACPSPSRSGHDADISSLGLLQPDRRSRERRRRWVRARAIRSSGHGAERTGPAPSSRRLLSGARRVELDSINERVLIDRPGVRGAPAQRLAVRLAGSSDILPRDRRERDELNCVDLDLTRADPVAAALLNPRPLPKSDQERDVSRQDVATQLAAELHTRASRDPPETPRRSVPRSPRSRLGPGSARPERRHCARAFGERQTELSSRRSRAAACWYSRRLATRSAAARAVRRTAV
jgi:hypothetical protein